MIEINLLPHREARRAADLRQTVGLLALGLVIVVGGIWFANKNLKASQTMAEASVRQLEADIERFKPEEKKVADFKRKRGELEDKLEIIRNLDAARRGPVRILEELSKTTPERLWLTKLQTEGTGITLEGQSLDTGVVADFLRNLNASSYFDSVDLERTVSGREVEGVKLVKFVIKAELAKPAKDGEGQAQGA
jgi:type IV pilus assembly protein PilN